MRLACWQTAVRQEDGDRRLERLTRVAERARTAGASLLVTPELSLTGYDTRALEVRHAAARAEGLAERASAIAATVGIAMVFGYPERIGPWVYNTVCLVGPDGAQLAVYHKVHLCGPHERSAFVAGADGVVQGRVAGLTVGLLICYDFEFPEPVRAHAVHGADLIVVPSALTRPWEHVARLLVPARAIENQFYVAYANWSGADGRAEYCGLSQVAGPRGEVRTMPEGGDLLLADVRPTRIKTARAGLSYLADRRPELYGDVRESRR